MNCYSALHAADQVQDHNALLKSMHSGNGTVTHGKRLHSGKGTVTNGRPLKSGNDSGMGTDATALHLNCYRAFR